MEILRGTALLRELNCPSVLRSDDTCTKKTRQIAIFLFRNRRLRDLLYRCVVSIQQAYFTRSEEITLAYQVPTTYTYTLYTLVTYLSKLGQEGCYIIVFHTISLILIGLSSTHELTPSIYLILIVHLCFYRYN